VNTGLSRGGSSRRAAELQSSLKNVRQKIPPNSQTRLKLGFSYENFTAQSFSVLPTPFLLNVSYESNITNVSLFSNDAAYAMTFSAHLPMNLAISGLSSTQPWRKETKQLATKNMVVYPPIAKRFWYFDDEFLKKKRRKYDLDCFYYLNFLDIEIYNEV